MNGNRRNRRRAMLGKLRRVIKENSSYFVPHANYDFKRRIWRRGQKK